MNENILKDGLSKFGIEISSFQLSQFQDFSNILVDANKKMNLTRILDSDSISVKHFLDSAALLSFFSIPNGSNLIDVGTGAGFPGIPIKILRPDIGLTLVESVQKKALFLSRTIKTLSLENVLVSYKRAEEFSHEKIARGQYSFVVSRAVAKLPILSELCIPFLSIGGYFIAYKSLDISEELEQSKSIIETLGAVVERVERIDFYDISRTFVIVKKIRNTPSEYPRKFSKML